jgi:hypothetical protein
MLNDIEKIRYQNACIQTDAIFALEGFEPSEQHKALDRAVLAGRVTPEQVCDEMLAYAKQHKSTDGFAASRTWI